MERRQVLRGVMDMVGAGIAPYIWRECGGLQFYRRVDCATTENTTLILVDSSTLGEEQGKARKTCMQIRDEGPQHPWGSLRS